MARWTIYSKNGSVRYNNVPDLSYNGTWMGECFVSVTVRSAVPVDFEIGDYIIYRGEKFVLNNVPSVVKKARRNTYGEGFCYEQMKFSSLSTELSDIKFRDIVLDDNLVHYSSLPRFSFYAADIEDFADRLQANTNRWCADNVFRLADYWKFITPNLQRSLRRGVTLEEYNEAYGGSFYTDGEKYDVSVVIDNMTVWNSLTMIKENFGLNFVSKGRRVIIAGAGVPTSDIFRYGKGNGLYEIERVADSEQQVVTKLFAYGSEKNMPIRYYANLGIICWAKMYSRPSLESHFFSLDLVWNNDYFTGTPDADGKYPVVFTFDGSNYNVKAYSIEVGARVLVALEGNISFDFIEQTDELIFTGGIDKDKWAKSNVRYTTGNLPTNMAINCLMLPGFPNVALSDLCRCTYDSINDKTQFEIRKTTSDAYQVFLEIEGSHLVDFSTDEYDPYLLSVNRSSIGIKEGDISFTEEGDDNGLKEIYPSIEGLTYGDIDGTTSDERIDELYAAEMITDDGIFGEGETTPPTFTITLKRLGFDLEQAFNNAGGQMSISMKDGYCGGRDFQVKSVRADGTRWICTCERHHDSLLNLYYPYSYNVSIGGEPSSDEPYQLRSGDHYVITGIYIEDSSYIWAASIKMLRKSILWLLSNDYTRYTYAPKVDEIYMAYQHENHAQGEKSYHDTLKEGNVMQFEDIDLDIDGSIYIDTLRINEHANNGIPTYDITLRNDKQVGTLQRIQNQISSLSSYVSGGGGGMSVAQIREIVSSFGKDHYISKTLEDTASGLITFAKGLVSKIKSLFEKGIQIGANFVSGRSNSGAQIDEYGNGELESIIIRSLITSPQFVEGFAGEGMRVWKDRLGNWNAELDGITVRGTMRVYELLIDKLKSVGGQILVSKANGKVKEVEEDSNHYYLSFETANEFAVGDLIRCQTFTGTTLKSYWVRVQGIDNGRVVINKQGEDWMSGVPANGDEVVLCGNDTDTTRQAAILISSSQESSGEPIISVLSGINSRSFANCLRTRLGYLGDINDASFSPSQLSGYGLYGENVYLKGTFMLKNGNTYIDVGDSITMAVGNLVIGKNLLLNPDFSYENFLNYFSFNNRNDSVRHIDSNLPQGFESGMAFTAEVGSTGVYSTRYDGQPIYPLTAGKQYTLSFWGRLTDEASGSGNNFYFGLENKEIKQIEMNQTWQRYSVTFTPDAQSVNNALVFYTVRDDAVAITGLKLEEGESATAWEDAQAKIEVLSNSITMAVGNLVIGKNLLLNPDFSYDDFRSHWAATNTATHIDTNLPQGFESGMAFTIQEGMSGIYANAAEQPQLFPLTVGKRYTMSFWGRTTETIAGDEDNFNFGQEAQGGFKNVKLTNDWQRFTHTFTATANNSIILYGTKAGGYAITGLKLESGDKATAWEDTQAKIEVLSNQINLSVKKDELETVGIHLDGENSKISLNAKTTEVSDDLVVKRVLTNRGYSGVVASMENGIIKAEFGDQKAMFGINDNGQLVLQFWQNNQIVCDLSPDGLVSRFTEVQESWTELKEFISLGNAATPSDWIIDTKTLSGTKYYQYNAGFKQIQNEKYYYNPQTGKYDLREPPQQNGKVFSSKSTTGAHIADGWFRSENLDGEYPAEGYPDKDVYFFEIFKFENGKQVDNAYVWFRKDFAIEPDTGRLTTITGERLWNADSYPYLYSYYNTIRTDK